MADCSRVNIAFAGPRPSDSASATIYQCPHQNTEGPGNDVELPSLPAALNAAPCSEQGTSKTSKLAVSIPAPREDKKGIAIRIQTPSCIGLLRGVDIHTIFCSKTKESMYIFIFRGKRTGNCVCAV